MVWRRRRSLLLSCVEINELWGGTYLDVRPPIFGGYIDDLVQDCSNSIALAMELLQSCTKPSIYHIFVSWNNVLLSQRTVRDSSSCDIFSGILSARWHLFTGPMTNLEQQTFGKHLWKYITAKSHERHAWRLKSPKKSPRWLKCWCVCIQHKIHENFGARSRYLMYEKVMASHSILWDAITSPCPRDPILVSKSL